MNSNALRAKMVLLDISPKTLCEKTGISKSAFYRKLSGKSEFTRDEIQKIIDALSMTKSETLSIFFDNEVS